MNVDLQHDERKPVWKGGDAYLDTSAKNINESFPLKTLGYLSWKSIPFPPHGFGTKFILGTLDLARLIVTIKDVSTL